VTWYLIISGNRPCIIGGGYQCNLLLDMFYTTIRDLWLPAGLVELNNVEQWGKALKKNKILISFGTMVSWDIKPLIN